MKNVHKLKKKIMRDHQVKPGQHFMWKMYYSQTSKQQQRPFFASAHSVSFKHISHTLQLNPGKVKYEKLRCQKQHKQVLEHAALWG